MGHAQTASHGQEGRQTDLLSGALHLVTGSNSLGDSLWEEGRLPSGRLACQSQKRRPPPHSSTRGRTGCEAAPGGRGSTLHPLPPPGPLDRDNALS